MKGNTMEDAPPNTSVTVSREKLHTQVWATPMQHRAVRYGITGNGLAKIRDQLNLPCPPCRYWAKRAAIKNPPADN